MAKKLNLNLQNLPPAVRIGIAIIPTIIIIIGFYFIAYKPNAAKIKRLKSDIAVQEKEIAKNEAKVAKLAEIKKRYAELEFKLKVLSQQLPEEKEVSGLLKQISDYGVQAGLVIKLWKPGKRSKHSSQIVYVIPVNVKMTGTYHSLGSFYSRLTGLDRIVNIKDIKLDKAPEKEGLGSLKISFTAQTFSAVPASELTPVGEKGKKRKR